MPYNIYPGVDDDYKFPPLVRQGMALYTELINAFAGKALEAEVSSHKANVSNPHSVTKTQVGLGNVDNTSDANKPVSTPQATALNLKAPLASPTFTGTVNGITKAMVGLSSVDNTSDVNKPVSNAQTALFIPRWKPATAYNAAQQVVSPNNEIVSALTSHTSGATYSAASWSTPPSIASVSKGAVRRVKTTTTQGPFGSGAASAGVVANIPSFTFLAGRKYSLHFSFEYAGNTTGNYASIDISSCAVADSATSNANLTKLGGSSCRIHDINGNHADAFAFFDPTVDTTVQLKVTAWIWSGGGNVSIQSSANNPAVFTIKDEGAQF